MLVLIVIGFLAGIVTGISPCILPVVPVIFAAGAATGVSDERDLKAAGESGADTKSDQPKVKVPVGASAAKSSAAKSTAAKSSAAKSSLGVGAPKGKPHAPAPSVPLGKTGLPLSKAQLDRAELRRQRRRPFAVVGGLVLSFSLATLIGSSLLSFFDLPQDLLRDLGLIVLAVVALGLIIPPLGDLLERPFAYLVRGRQHNDAGGFILGMSLGLLFVPCAGPVLTAIVVVGQNHHVGFRAVLLTAAFACGVAIPLLFFAIAGQRIVGKMPTLRNRARVVRQVVGVILLLTSLAIWLNLTNGLQTALPGYTNALQNQFDNNGTAKQALGTVSGNTVTGDLANCQDGNPSLQSCGPAPAFKGISTWLNTPGGKPLTIAGLKGKVVLVDFWTYSCINCQRSLPHVEAWNAAYAADGLVVVGVHTPEFAFEHVPSNVAAAAKQLGVTYPIAIDNNYGTWNNYQNDSWPAEYLIDAKGEIRHLDVGEGAYSQTEAFIRQLLVAANPAVHLPPATDVANKTPTEETTRETYLGYQNQQEQGDNGAYGQNVIDDQQTTYVLPSSIPPDSYSIGGQWNVQNEQMVAGKNATVTLNFQAKDVYLVLGGTGTVGVSVNGKPTSSVSISGIPRLYTLFSSSSTTNGALTLTVPSGVAAYDFTFG